jgi:hypothetical protein
MKVPILFHTVKVIDDVSLIFREGLVIPFTKLIDFPKCCGAGDGIGKLIVPDSIYGLKVSAACFIHDDDWENAEPTWDAFHSANSRFLTNLLAIINTKSYSWFFRIPRRYRAMTYYSAVDEASFIFWRLKKKQKEQGMWGDYELPKGQK